MISYLFQFPFGPRFPFLFIPNIAKPAPLRNCTLRPYSTTPYPAAVNTTNSSVATSSSSSASFAHHHHHRYQQQQQQSQQQPNSMHELNYMNAEYVKDRGVYVSPASSSGSSSNNKKVTLLTTTKFNQKTSTSNVGTFAHDPNAKNRRNTKNSNPDNNKKMRKDKNVDGDGMGRSRSSRSNRFTGDNSDSNGHSNNKRKISSVSYSPTTKSNLSYLSWKADKQRISKRQTAHQNTKHSINNKNYGIRGRDGHKTNVDDNNVNAMNMNSAMKIKTTDGHIVHEHVIESVAAVPSSSSSIILPKTESVDVIEPVAMNVHKNKSNNNIGISKQHSNNNNNFKALMNDRDITNNNDNAINSLPSVAYLQAATAESKSVENVNNLNNNNNNNNVFVDAYEPAPTAMELECVAGYDGGLPQYFVLEAYDSRTKQLRLNITSAFGELPLFRIDLAGLFVCLFVYLHLLIDSIFI